MRGPIALALVIASAPMFGVEAQAASFQIRLRARGPGGPLPCADPGGISDDIFTGKVTGDESELASSQEIVYRGVLERKSNLLFCDASRSPGSGEDRLCWMQISGGGKMNVELTIPADGVHTYVKLEPIRKSMHVDQSPGDCDQELAAGIVETYLTGGEGADIQCAPKAPLREKTKCAQPSSGHGDPPGPWTLEVLGAKKLRAVPGGPYSVVRGQELTLDGSRSEGDITDYTWKIATKNCKDAYDQPVEESVEKHGASVKIRPLCAIEATLEVTDGTGKDGPKAASIAFSPRTATTSFDSQPGILMNAGLIAPCGCELGRNICAVEYGPVRNVYGTESKHYFHRVSDVASYDNVQYELARNTDPSGLFDQWWWVSKPKVHLDRRELVNVLLTSTTLAKKNNGDTKDDLELLIGAVKAHEAAHSKLIHQGASSLDPATKVETLFLPQSGDVSELRKCADSIIDQSDGRIRFFDSEQKVVDELKGGPFDKHADVLLPESRGGAYRNQPFDTPATETDRPLGQDGGPAPASDWAPCSALSAPSIPSSGTNSPPPAPPPLFQ